jgi:glucan-binding YG repeat protein
VKKIIALTSLLFVLLMSVLPAQSAQVSAAANVGVTGVKLHTSAGVITGTGSNNTFKFNLHGVAKNVLVNKIEFTSTTAAYVSIFSREEIKDMYESQAEYESEMEYTLEQLYDLYDIRFENGVAYLDKEKFDKWANRFEIPVDETDGLVGDSNLTTIEELDSIFGDVSFELFAGDAAGNETALNLHFDIPGVWELIDGLWYYWDNGDYVTGWLFWQGKWYYLDPKNDGAMVTDWKYVGGKWYYFDLKNGDMKTGWLKWSNKWYYLDAKNGDMKTGWVFVGGKWYYLENSGAMKTNWVILGGKWYFLDRTNGDMKTGWVLYNNKWYYLNTTTGAMATNTWVSGKYWVNKDGVWVK